MNALGKEREDLKKTQIEVAIGLNLIGLTTMFYYQNTSQKVLTCYTIPIILFMNEGNYYKSSILGRQSFISSSI
jgi:hypothetical protein